MKFASLLISAFVSKYILKNTKQVKFQEFINNPKLNIVVCTGPAGTGKTMIPCQEAIRKLKNEEINKIIITRPAVPVEENLGFLPGTFEDKVYPYMIPIYDYFLEHYTKEGLTTLIRSGKLEIAPLAFMRGRTFKDAIIIADEMQNTSPSQMKMILTRIGNNSKLIITGDLQQNDINIETNGLQELVNLLGNKYPEYHLMLKDGFGYIHFDNSCIQRSAVIEKVLNLYN
uniref:PhoH-like protein n=1 Tax=viral metagenome TaxID=1070528 RepID=A0A6C0D9G8_9ZZZZ